MERRSLLAALFSAPAIAAPALSPAPGFDRCGRAYKDPLCTGEWNIKPYVGRIEFDCYTPFCDAGFDAPKWVVIDRCTNAQRVFCEACKEEFRRQPVRLFWPPERADAWPARLRVGDKGVTATDAVGLQGEFMSWDSLDHLRGQHTEPVKFYGHLGPNLITMDAPIGTVVRIRASSDSAAMWRDDRSYYYAGQGRIDTFELPFDVGPSDRLFFESSAGKVWWRAWEK